MDICPVEVTVFDSDSQDPDLKTPIAILDPKITGQYLINYLSHGGGFELLYLR